MQEASYKDERRPDAIGVSLVVFVGEGDEDMMGDDGERVQFQSLFQTVVTAAKPNLRSESSLSILELQVGVGVWNQSQLSRSIIGSSERPMID